MEQYSQYVYYYQKLRKTEAQSENIADNGGLRLAYAAYEKWQQQKSMHTSPYPEELPLLNYSNKKLFFISYAQFWCNDVHPRYRGYRANVDNHVPSQLRVIGSLSNFEQFAKAFNCTKGSPMNPVDKCQLY